MKLVVNFCLLLFFITYDSGAQPSLNNQLDSFLQTQFKPNEPGGVVMVAKNGKTIYKKAFGMADLELNVKTNDSMVYYIGSNTKKFTAVAMLQLLEKNKLQLQDTLGKYLRESPTRRHGGRTFGYISETLYLPKEAVYVIILTNSDYTYFPIRVVTRVAAALAINKPFLFTDQPINANELDKFVGAYKNKLNETINIAIEEGKLMFQRPGGNKYKLGYALNNEFFMKDFLRVQFMSDATGNIASLNFSQVDMQPMEWVKTQP